MRLAPGPPKMDSEVICLVVTLVNYNYLTLILGDYPPEFSYERSD